MRIWMLSNDIQLVPFDEGERRFKCFNLLSTYAGIETPATKAYFKPMWEHPPQVLAMLLYHHDISNWNPRTFDIGVAGHEQMAAILRGVQLWWKSCLDDAAVAVEKEDRQAGGERPIKRPHRRTWPFGGLPVPKDVVYAHYVKFCNDTRVPRNAVEIRSTAFKQLYQLVPFAAKKEFTARADYAQQAAKRPACLIFPTLSDCRSAWCKTYGEIDTDGWGEDDGDGVSYNLAWDGSYGEPRWMAVD